MVPFVDVPWHPAHVTKVVPSTITICGITELIKTETGELSFLLDESLHRISDPIAVLVTLSLASTHHVTDNWGNP